MEPRNILGWILILCVYLLWYAVRNEGRLRAIGAALHRLECPECTLKRMDAIEEAKRHE